jgi:hypothetical protein
VEKLLVAICKMKVQLGATGILEVFVGIPRNFGGIPQKQKAGI